MPTNTHSSLVGSEDCSSPLQSSRDKAGVVPLSPETPNRAVTNAAGLLQSRGRAAARSNQCLARQSTSLFSRVIAGATRPPDELEKRPPDRFGRLLRQVKEQCPPNETTLLLSIERSHALRATAEASSGRGRRGRRHRRRAAARA
jgi:hypothetical protein